MKAITVWQLYASLLVLGLKQFETRGWGTAYRGCLAIHAAKRWDDEREQDYQRVMDLLSPEQLASVAGVQLARTPIRETLGKVLGIVDLTDCRQMRMSGSEFEDSVGHFGFGRWGWKCENPRPLQTPVYYCGKQGLWNVDAELHSVLVSQLCFAETANP